MSGDVRDNAVPAALLKFAKDDFLGPHGALNNAGITGNTRPVSEMERASWKDVLQVNLDRGSDTAGPQLPAIYNRGGGSIDFTSSLMPTLDLPGKGLIQPRQRA